ncbi:hypothetical protein WG901_10105 [Novosphingobium sp. PS1R-30]|uniref:Uncharacterized protein n=1 Tax=Novosphingobium anseongense TaxID=3133436 RepID=A0ABU8RW48_9SPHN
MTVSDTLADLHRLNCNLWAQCLGCNKINTLMTSVLAGRIGNPGGYHEGMEKITIGDVLARMKCSSFGGRDFDWRAMKRGR